MKSTTRTKTLFYLFLALICYTLASIYTATISVILFITVGGIAELIFWFNLFKNGRKPKQH